MKNSSMILAVFLGALGFIPSVPCQGRDLVSLRRVRSVPNPVPESLPAEEMLEVTFSLNSPGWVDGLGWVTRYYDEDRQLLGEETAAYIEPGKNLMTRIRGRNFKGGTVFSLLFPVREGAAYLVLALGDGFRREVILYPYTALLEEFNIPVGELDAALSRSRLNILEN